MEFDDEVGFVFDLCDGGEECAEVEHFSLFVAAAAEEKSDCFLVDELIGGLEELLWCEEGFHVVEVDMIAVFTVKSALGAGHGDRGKTGPYIVCFEVFCHVFFTGRLLRMLMSSWCEKLWCGSFMFLMCVRRVVSWVSLGVMPFCWRRCLSICLPVCFPMTSFLVLPTSVGGIGS